MTLRSGPAHAAPPPTPGPVFLLADAQGDPTCLLPSQVSKAQTG